MTDEHLKDSTGKPSSTRKIFTMTMMWVVPLVIATLAVCAVITALFFKDSDLVGKFLESLISLCGIHVTGGTVGMATGHFKEAALKNDQPV